MSPHLWFRCLVTLWITRFLHYWNGFFIAMQHDFFRKLMDLFGICEGLENIDGLHMIYRIVKGISEWSHHAYICIYINIYCKTKNFLYNCVLFTLSLSLCSFDEQSSNFWENIWRWADHGYNWLPWVYVASPPLPPPPPPPTPTPQHQPSDVFCVWLHVHVLVCGNCIFFEVAVWIWFALVDDELGCFHFYFDHVKASKIFYQLLWLKKTTTNSSVLCHNCYP